jgi:THO complex subunit 1
VSEGADDGLYAKFWSLQVYFANPPYVSGKLPGPKGLPKPRLQDFKLKTEAVLPRLFAETEKAKRNAAVERVGQKRKRETEEEDQAFFHPRLLTDKRLFEYQVGVSRLAIRGLVAHAQLADLSFRRQILAQYYIFFQFLLNFGDKSAPNQKNHMMPQDFRIDDLTNRWIKARISEIMQDLAGEAADGQRFKDVLLGIIMKERHHVGLRRRVSFPDLG